VPQAVTGDRSPGTFAPEEVGDTELVELFERRARLLQQQVLPALRLERLEFTVDGAQRLRKLLQLPAGLADLRA
jgi:hypothetical protein